MRRLVALALVLSLLCSGMSGCSQPIDTGSSIPAQSQPIVTLLALVGLGIALTAYHHHNEHLGGGGGGPSIVGATNFVAPFLSGNRPVDLAIDPVNSSLGTLQLPISGSGTATFEEVTPSGAGVAAVGSYSLPTNYAPRAMSVDTSGLAWYVDQTGHVQECDVLSVSSTTCSSLGTFVDSLAAGARSIAADPNFVIVVEDGGSGNVLWWVRSIQLSASTSGSFLSTASTAALDTADAVKSTPSGGITGFTIFHQDGASDIITFTVSGSSFTLNHQTSYAYNPVPVESPTDFFFDTLNNVIRYAPAGTASGTYRITKYSSAAFAGLGQPTASGETIEEGGRVGNPAAPFVAPLSSWHADTANALIWAIDANGNIVGFTLF